MNDFKTHNQTEKKISPAKLGVVIGAILSLLGTVAGFYFGVVRPALLSGKLYELPVRSVLMGAVLGALLILVCGIGLWRWVRGPKRPPAESDADEW